MQHSQIIPLSSTASPKKVKNQVIYQAQITEITEHGNFLVDHHVHAEQAYSCLIRPQIGDQVLCSQSWEGPHYILAILKRSGTQGAYLTVPGEDQLTVHSKKLSIESEKKLELSSLGDLAINACLGTLSVNAFNLFSSVTDNLIQSVKNHIQKVRYFSLESTGLVRTHGTQHLMTAEEDIKIDAERINMG